MKLALATTALVILNTPARIFREIKAHNCTAVLLALSEFDIFFWAPNIPKIVDEAKRAGLKVYLDTWGIGKFFGGEPPSVFLQENVRNRQVTALTDEPVAAACFQHAGLP